MAEAESALHAWAEREKSSLRALLASSAAPYSSLYEGLVANTGAEMSCGWKSIRPCAEYNCSVTRRKHHSGPRVSRPQAHNLDHTACWSYMSGQLDPDYSYRHAGGLSDKVRGDRESFQPHMTQPPAAYHKQVVSLDPAMPYLYRSSLQRDVARRDLSAILAMQLKPELLVEQLIIENRLRTMSLSAFQPLEGIGVDGKIKLQSKIATKSHSSTSLIPHPQQHRKHKRRRVKPKGPLEWCKLAQTGAKDMPVRGEDVREGAAILMPFGSKEGRSGFTGGVSALKQTALPIMQPGMVNLSRCKVLPVISPQLDVERKTQKQIAAKLRSSSKALSPPHL